MRSVTLPSAPPSSSPSATAQPSAPEPSGEPETGDHDDERDAGQEDRVPGPDAEGGAGVVGEIEPEQVADERPRHARPSGCAAPTTW